MFKHCVRVLINFVRWTCPQSLCIVSTSLNVYLFYPMSKKIVNSYQTIANVVVNISKSFNFNRKANLKTIRISIVVLRQQNMKFKVLHVRVCKSAGCSLVVTFPVILWNMKVNTPGMYLATSLLYSPLLINLLIFTSFWFTLSNSDVVLSISFELPIL